MLPSGGDPTVGAAIDPAAGEGNACVTTATGDVSRDRHVPAAAGALRRLHAAGGADCDRRCWRSRASQDTAQMAARLWDVGPEGASQRLVARGLYRPRARKREVFQLHPNGYRFRGGHVAKLELLGSDPPYGRVSNAPFRVEVERLELRLPVREQPDCDDDPRGSGARGPRRSDVWRPGRLARQRYERADAPQAEHERTRSPARRRAGNQGTPARSFGQDTRIRGQAEQAACPSRVSHSLGCVRGRAAALACGAALRRVHRRLGGRSRGVSCGPCPTSASRSPRSRRIPGSSTMR